MVTFKLNGTTKLADISIDGQVVKSVTFGEVANEVKLLRAVVAKAVAPKFVAKPFTNGQYHFGASKSYR